MSTESLTSPELQAALDFLNRSIEDLSPAKSKLQALPPLCANPEKHLRATLPVTSEHYRVLRFLDRHKFNGENHWVLLSIPEMERLCYELVALLERNDLVESWGAASTSSRVRPRI